MELLDNISRLFGDDLKQTLKLAARLKIAASCFSRYAYEALKAELEQIEELQFIFTSPTFLPNEASDKIRKERREFHIPKLDRERSLYGSEFESSYATSSRSAPLPASAPTGCATRPSSCPT